MKEYEAYVLFDTGATHLFVTTSLAKRLGLPIATTTTSLRIKTPTGSVVSTQEMIRDCRLKIQGHQSSSDLIVLDMNKYEVILGMTWLSKTQAVVDCQRRTISFVDLHGKIVEFLGETTVPRELGLSSFELMMEDEEMIPIEAMLDDKDS